MKLMATTAHPDDESLGMGGTIRGRVDLVAHGQRDRSPDGAVDRRTAGLPAGLRGCVGQRREHREHDRLVGRPGGKIPGRCPQVGHTERQPPPSVRVGGDPYVDREGLGSVWDRNGRGTVDSHRWRTTHGRERPSSSHPGGPPIRGSPFHGRGHRRVGEHGPRRSSGRNRSYLQRRGPVVPRRRRLRRVRPPRFRERRRTCGPSPRQIRSPSIPTSGSTRLWRPAVSW